MKEKQANRGRKGLTTKAEPEQARELRKQGLTVNEIAKALGVSRRTTQRYLNQYQ